MNEFELSVLRFSPDPATGEAVNVGVVAFDPSNGRAQARVLKSVERVTAAFPGVSAPLVRRWLRSFEIGVAQHDADIETGTYMSRARSLDSLLRTMVPDQGASFWFADVVKVCGASLEDVVGWWESQLVTRWIGQQVRDRRADEDVFRSISAQIRQSGIEVHWTPSKFKVDNAVIECDHVFYNGRPHVVEAASLDYVSVDSISTRVDRLIGKAIRLDLVPNIGNIFVLIGPPSRTDLHKAADRHVTTLRAALPDRAEIFYEAKGGASEFAKAVRSLFSDHD